MRDPLRQGRPLYKGHLLWHHANTLVHYFTSEIGTTSLQGTKLLAPKCPLFGDSTVQLTKQQRTIFCTELFPTLRIQKNYSAIIYLVAHVGRDENHEKVVDNYDGFQLKRLASCHQPGSGVAHGEVCET